MVKIITDADIITGDKEKRYPESLVINKDTIDFVGDFDEAARRFGSDAEIRRLEGRTVVPGFNDNHIHMAFTGRVKALPDVSGLSADDTVAALVGAFPNPAKGQVLDATGWDYPACPNPHRSILDEAFPDNPVLISQFGGHATWMNSAALRRYGITKRTRDPKRGQILKDPNGEPTGIVREYRSVRIVLENLFKYMGSRWAYENLKVGLKLLREAGVTSVQDNTWLPPHINAIRRLHDEGLLTSRFSCWHYGQLPLLAHWMRLKRFLPPCFHDGPWKYLLDGTFTTRTAWLSTDYADEPGNAGKGVSDKAIFGILSSLARHGRQGAFHAIGDRTITNFLDALERVYDRHPDAQRLRFRLEHAQLIKDTDIPRLADLHVLICAQPHALAFEEKDKTLLGAERAHDAYPFRKLLDAGVALSFGSDYPGEETFAPLYGMHLAVNRTDGRSITTEEALACYTSGSAFAEFAEDAKGKLKEGFLADLTVLDGNPLKVDPQNLMNINVVETIVGGKTVYRR